MASRLKNAAEQLKQALEKIAQAKQNPQQLDQAIADAKAKAEALVAEADDDE